MEHGVLDLPDSIDVIVVDVFDVVHLEARDAIGGRAVNAVYAFQSLMGTQADQRCPSPDKRLQALSTCKFSGTVSCSVTPRPLSL